MTERRNTPYPGWKSDSTEMGWHGWLLFAIYVGTPLFFIGWWLVEVVRGI